MVSATLTSGCKWPSSATSVIGRPIVDGMCIFSPALTSRSSTPLEAVAAAVDEPTFTCEADGLAGSKAAPSTR
ncbi:MAG TPA: hypothetical protein VNO25_19925 [Streptosporangiaceae bacterium]|nr:hypothetical protein [Streptosporangiaceae bacterium]